MKHPLFLGHLALQLFFTVHVLLVRLQCVPLDPNDIFPFSPDIFFFEPTDSENSKFTFFGLY